MFIRRPTRASILALFALTTFSTVLLAHTANAQTPAHYKAQRAQLARISRGMTLLRQSIVDLGKKLSTVAPVNTPTPPETSPAVATPIGPNKPTANWLTFDFYPGRRGEAVSFHNATGIGVAFRIKEGGTLVQEYKLEFPFAERTAEQRVADAFMIQTCINDFHRVMHTDGGAFYINASSDPKIGLLCSSVL